MIRRNKINFQHYKGIFKDCIIKFLLMIPFLRYIIKIKYSTPVTHQLEQIFLRTSSNNIHSDFNENISNIAFWTTIGNLKFSGFDLLIGKALQARNANPVMVLCGGTVPICDNIIFSNINYNHINFEKSLTNRCLTCEYPGKRLFKKAKLSQLTIQNIQNEIILDDEYSSITEKEMLDIKSLYYKGINIGRHIDGSIKRFYLSEEYQTESSFKFIVNKYYITAKYLVDIADKLIEKGIDTLILHHGVYVMQGVPNEVFNARGKRAIVWAPGQREQSYRASHRETFWLKRQIERNLWAKELTINQKDIVDKLLKQRVFGTKNINVFHKNSMDKSDDIVSFLDLDINLPIITLFTNVGWDAAVFYDSEIFKTMIDWIFYTVGIAISSEAFQLIIRIHPAEIRKGHLSRQPVEKLIEKEFGVLPKNIKIVNPSSKINSYAIGQISTLSVVYGTEIGMELAALGGTVVTVANNTFVKKGFTIDLNKLEDYYYCLLNSRLIAQNKVNFKDLATKYVYYYYFKSTFDFPFLDYFDPYPFKINSFNDLEPGKSQPLDLICIAILEGKEFIN